MHRPQRFQEIAGQLRHAGTVLVGLGLLATPGWTNAATNYCTMTANTAYLACHAASQEDFWTANGNCLNESNTTARQACATDVNKARKNDEALSTLALGRARAVWHAGHVWRAGPVARRPRLARRRRYRP